VILGLELKKVSERLEKKEIILALDEKAHEFLVNKGHDPEYGARPMRRAVERYLEDPLAEDILRGNLADGEPVVVSADEEKLTFSQKPATEKAVAGD
jgi:ATP-dependent Clp protease ATP-binding subunit ClpC